MPSPFPLGFVIFVKNIIIYLIVPSLDQVESEKKSFPPPPSSPQTIDHQSLLTLPPKCLQIVHFCPSLNVVRKLLTIWASYSLCFSPKIHSWPLAVMLCLDHDLGPVGDLTGKALARVSFRKGKMRLFLSTPALSAGPTFVLSLTSLVKFCHTPTPLSFQAEGCQWLAIPFFVLICSHQCK